MFGNLKAGFEVLKKGKTKAPIRSWLPAWELSADTYAQLENAANHPTVGSAVAVMPDAHVGYGVSIGCVFPTVNAVIPNAVGVDIGCVDGDTEFLSPTGWKRISDYAGEDVLQYDAESGEASFITPLRYIEKPTDRFLHFTTKYGIDQMLTPDHRVLAWKITGRDRRRERTVLLAEDLAEIHERQVQGAKYEIETSFGFRGEGRVDLSDDKIRLQVAVNADAYIERGTRAVVRLRKGRKIKRLRDLLHRTSTHFSEYVDDEGVTHFRFIPPLLSKSFDLFWGADAAQLKIIAEECLKWDGNEDHSCFYTRDKEAADLVQFAFSVAGYRSVMRVDPPRREGDGPDYRVFAHRTTKVGLAGVPKTPVRVIEGDDLTAYCFTVPTGFWVMRRNGKVAVTGNCGMAAVDTGIPFDAERMDEAFWNEWASVVNKLVPTGFSTHKESKDLGDLERDLRARELQPLIEAKASVQIGTLGGGNHFLEAQVDERGIIWLMVHSGSRHTGLRIANHYHRLAVEMTGKESTKDLAYLPLDDQTGQDYLHDMQWATDFASASRKRMVTSMLVGLSAALGEGVDSLTYIDCRHNYAELEEHDGMKQMVHRKGATNARLDQLGIIPGSMGSNSFIVKGKGSVDSLESCSHGAGRSMGRGAAKQAISQEDFEYALQGTFSKASMGYVDEAPQAYKSIDLVMSRQTDLVDIVHTLKPIITLKGDSKAKDD